MCCRYVTVPTYININVIDKHLAIYQLWKWEKDLFTTKDNKREHAFCIFRSVVESASKTIQIKKN